MKNLERAVRLFRSLVETGSDVQVTSSTLWSWPETENALATNPEASQILTEMRSLPDAVRERTMRYCGAFEPLEPKGDVYVFPNTGAAQSFITEMEVSGAVVDHLADEVVAAHGETPAHVEEIAIRHGGTPWSGASLGDAFESVDTDLPYAMISAMVEPEEMEAALVEALWKPQTSALSEAFISSPAPTAAAQFRGRLRAWARPRPVFGVEARLFEALRMSGALPRQLCLMVEADPQGGATTAAPGAAAGPPDDRGGVAKDQPTPGTGAPAQSAQDKPELPPQPTEHVPTQEEGGTMMGQVKLPDGTVVPPDIMRQAIAKVLKNIATQVEQGTTSGKPDPKPAQDADKPQEQPAPEEEKPEEPQAPQPQAQQATPQQGQAVPGETAQQNPGAVESYRGIREDLDRALGMILSPRTRDVIAGINMVGESGLGGQPARVVERVLDELNTLKASPNARVRRAANNMLAQDLYRAESTRIPVLPNGLAYGDGQECAPGTPVVVVEDQGNRLVLRLPTGETVMAPASAVALSEAGRWRSKRSRAAVKTATSKAHAGKSRKDKQIRRIRTAQRGNAKKAAWGKSTKWRSDNEKRGGNIASRTRKRLGASVEGTEGNMTEDAKSVGGEILGRPYTMNVATVSPGEATAFAKDAFERAGLSLYTEIPDFDRNLMLLKRAMRHALDIPRIQMPVIEPSDLGKFNSDLKGGKVDIFKPYAAGALGQGRFPWYPEIRGGAKGKEWLKLGVMDGDPADDIIVPRPGQIPVKNLKPLQGEIWFDKLIGSLLKFGLPKPGGFLLTNAVVIVSQESYILDGHHRFGQAMLMDPSLKIKALKVPLDIHKLLKVGRSYGSAIGNTPKESVDPMIKGQGPLYNQRNPFKRMNEGYGSALQMGFAQRGFNTGLLSFKGSSASKPMKHLGAEVLNVIDHLRSDASDPEAKAAGGRVFDAMESFLRVLRESQINEQLDVGQDDEANSTARGFADTATKLKTCRQHTFDLVTKDLVQLESLARAVGAKRTTKLLAQTREKATDFLDALKETAEILDKANEAFKGEAGGKGGDNIDQEQQPAQAVAAAPPAPAGPVAPVAPGAPAPVAAVGEAVERIAKTSIPRLIFEGAVYSTLAEAISLHTSDLGLNAAQVSEVYDRFNRVALSSSKGAADYRVEFSTTDHRLLESVKRHGSTLSALVSRSGGRRETFATLDELVEAVSTLRKYGKVEHSMLADELELIVSGGC